MKKAAMSHRMIEYPVSSGNAHRVKEADVVEGSVHKPEVSYLVSRQEQEDLETLQLKESFIPKIVKSVEKAPF